jgi:hypothetical protein
MLKIAKRQGLSVEDVEHVLIESGYDRAMEGNYRFYRDILDRRHGKPTEHGEVKISGELTQGHLRELENEESGIISEALADFFGQKENQGE